VAESSDSMFTDRIECPAPRKMQSAGWDEGLKCELKSGPEFSDSPQSWLDAYKEMVPLNLEGPILFWKLAN
jgi:hypothetical protein